MFQCTCTIFYHYTIAIRLLSNTIISHYKFQRVIVDASYFIDVDATANVFQYIIFGYFNPLNNYFTKNYAVLAATINFIANHSHQDVG
jgi:hypothetical protein